MFGDLLSNGAVVRGVTIVGSDLDQLLEGGLLLGLIRLLMGCSNSQPC